MKECVKELKLTNLTIGVGCILYDITNNKIISRGHNYQQKTTIHAEIDALSHLIKTGLYSGCELA